MSDYIQKMITELEARKTYLRDIEDLKVFVENRLGPRVMCPKIELVLEKLLKTTVGFLQAVEEHEPFHPHFAPKRILCFLNIVEQTVISVMITAGKLSDKNFQIFGDDAVNLLNVSERERLLKFWRKQNEPRNSIRKVLTEWDSNTIRRMLTEASKM